MMIEIGMNGIVKNFGFKNVLNGAGFEIMTGERAAIVGRNGTGKTTLFKIIAGEENADKGEVSIRRGASVGLLEQIPSLSEDNALTREVLCAPFKETMRVEARMRELEALMSGSRISEAALEEYAVLQNRFAALDGYAMQENLDKAVNGFKLGELLDRPFNALSGGQKTVVKLASVILTQPDILLLDEPTNHLDIETLEWFEGFLAKYKGTILIISHDRQFLDRVVTKTIFLRDGKCEAFGGNYSFALKERERLLLLEFEQYKNQQKKIEAMRAAIKRFREWGARGDNEAMFRKAKELERRLEKMDMLERPQIEKPAVPISFSGERTGREVLIVRDFSLTLGEAELFKSAGFAIYEREKLCLTGGNGTGKTSLIKAALGDISGYSGEIKLNPSAKTGYIPQEIRFENDKATVLEAFRGEHICSEGEARGILAKYFFYGESVFKRVSALSGGEKVLLKLAALIQNKTNFLILDEPTNHIDIETREILEDALLDFSGTLFFISHDRYFISKLATRAVEVKNLGVHAAEGVIIRSGV